MNKTTISIARNIHHLMAENGVKTEAELARLSGLNQPTVHRILKGESRDPRLSNLKQIASVFAIPYWKLTEVDLTRTTPSEPENEYLHEVESKPKGLNHAQIALLQECLSYVVETKQLIGFDMPDRMIARASAGYFNYCLKMNIKPSNISHEVRDAVLGTAAGFDS